MSVKIIDALLKCPDPDAAIADFYAARDERLHVLLESGYEVVSGYDGGYVSDDDSIRPVFVFGGVAMAQQKEAHEKNVAAELESAVRRDAAATAAAVTPQTTCAALIDGQLCGGTISTAPVCPKCALGKQGVAQIMTCDVCGAQTAVMR